MDKEADKIKARRLPRFEALIPDELARLVNAEYAGLVRYIAERHPRPFGWRALAIAVKQLNTLKFIVRL